MIQRRQFTPRLDPGALKRAAILLAVIAATLLDQGSSALVTAEPFVAGSYGLSADQMGELNVANNSAYWVAIAMSPYVQRAFGVSRVYAAAFVLLGCISAAHVFAHGLTDLIAFRAVFGFAQGFIFVNSLALIIGTVTPVEVPFAFGLFALANLAGPTSAQLLSGVATDNFSWRVLYEWYVPVAFAVAVTVLALVREPPARRPAPFDIVGFGLASLAIVAYEVLATYGEQRDWFGDPDTVASIAVALGAGIAFVVWEIRGARHPLVRLGVLRLPNVRIGLPLTLVVGATLSGTSILVSFLQTVLDFSSTLAGAVVEVRLTTLLFFGPGAVLFALFGYIGPRRLMVLGFTCIAASFALEVTRVSVLGEPRAFALPLALSGIGFACAFGPLLESVVRSVPSAEATDVASCVKLALVFGSSASSLLIGSVLYDRRLAFHRGVVAEGAVAAKAAVAALLHQGARGAANVAQTIELQAQALAFQDALLVLGGLALAALALVPLLRPPAPIVPTKA